MFIEHVIYAPTSMFNDSRIQLHIQPQNNWENKINLISEYFRYVACYVTSLFLQICQYYVFYEDRIFYTFNTAPAVQKLLSCT